jgi:hypothetical protein
MISTAEKQVMRERVEALILTLDQLRTGGAHDTSQIMLDLKDLERMVVYIRSLEKNQKAVLQ